MDLCAGMQRPLRGGSTTSTSRRLIDDVMLLLRVGVSSRITQIRKAGDRDCWHLNTSAYLSEVFRGAIISVEKGQWEAGAALAMDWFTQMRVVILPQATRVALPPTGNYAVSLFKDSALASTVSVAEMLFTAQIIGSETFRYMEVYAVIGVLYLMVSYPTSLFLRWLEQARPD